MDSPTSDSPHLAPDSPELVWFTGPDALRFLNDLISQEIGDMEDGGARRSFLLGPQGKLDYLLWVVRDGERIGLVADKGRGDALAQALGRYRIRVDVSIELETSEVWIVVGPWQGFDLSWPGVERHLVVGPRPQLPVLTTDQYRVARIRAGEPAWDVDVDETTIPHESGLVPASVDFDKGCFLGQELVARIDSRGGNVPRRLRLIDGEEVALEVGASLSRDGEEVGVVTSAAGSMALAMVRRGVEPGQTVQVGRGRAVVRELPAESQR